MAFLYVKYDHLISQCGALPESPYVAAAYVAFPIFSKNEMNLAKTKQLLQEYYQLTTGIDTKSDKLPQQRIKSEWEAENKYGFLLGIVTFGLKEHSAKLYDLLNNDFKVHEQQFIESMFDYYIRPFHKSYRYQSSCYTPSETSRIIDYDPDGKEYAHKDFKEKIQNRDGICMFCWHIDPHHGAHIISEDFSNFEDGLSLFKKSGMNRFDKLKRYVDIVDDKLVVKVVNETNDETNLNWSDAISTIQAIRITKKASFWSYDERQAVESNGEMALYFVDKNTNFQPNRKALEFHKTACLIWRMTGGLEIDQEYCCDDEEDIPPVNTAALRKRFNIPAEDDLLHK